MKATYNKNAKTKFTSFHRKETKCYFDSYSALIRDEHGYTHAIVDLRLYGTGNTNSAALWVNCNAIYTSGTGSAGGYGYHRPSAAVAEAIRNAGIELDTDIAGRGDTSIEEAVKAMAAMLGYPDALIFHAHQ